MAIFHFISLKNRLARSKRAPIFTISSLSIIVAADLGGASFTAVELGNGDDKTFGTGRGGKSGPRESVGRGMTSLRAGAVLD